MAERTVSQILDAEYGIRGRPGTKVACPFCDRPYFFIKKDHSLGKCVSPSCLRFLTAQRHDAPARRTFSRLLEEMFHHWHQALLDLAPHPSREVPINTWWRSGRSLRKWSGT